MSLNRSCNLKSIRHHHYRHRKESKSYYEFNDYERTSHSISIENSIRLFRIGLDSNHFESWYQKKKKKTKNRIDLKRRKAKLIISHTQSICFEVPNLNFFLFSRINLSQLRFGIANFFFFLLKWKTKSSFFFFISKKSILFSIRSIKWWREETKTLAEIKLWINERDHSNI